jgi:hypothetical protein
MPESARHLEEVVEGVRERHPRLPVLLGGQGTGSLRVGEGTRVDDLELLAERVAPAA